MKVVAVSDAKPSQSRARAGIIVGCSAAALIVAGAAVAAIPSTSTGTYTACVNRTTGATRVIDYQAGRRCTSSERTITWSRGYHNRGAWSSTVSYVVDDVVTSGGSSYVARTSTINRNPATHPSAWALLARAGRNGATDGYEAISATQPSPSPNGFATITTLNLPSDTTNYELTAHVGFFNADAGWDCSLIAKDGSASATGTILDEGVFGSQFAPNPVYGSMTLVGLAPAIAGGSGTESAYVTCNNPSSQGVAQISARIVAITVDHVH